jgi:hypothetical protein
MLSKRLIFLILFIVLILEIDGNTTGITLASRGLGIVHSQAGNLGGQVYFGILSGVIGPSEQVVSGHIKIDAVGPKPLTIVFG